MGSGAGDAVSAQLFVVALFAAFIAVFVLISWWGDRCEERVWREHLELIAGLYPRPK